MVIPRVSFDPTEFFYMVSWCRFHAETVSKMAMVQISPIEIELKHAVKPQKKKKKHYHLPVLFLAGKVTCPGMWTYPKGMLPQLHGEAVMEYLQISHFLGTNVKDETSHFTFSYVN